MAYFLAAGAASVLFILAGWRSKNVRSLIAARQRCGLPQDSLWADPEIDIDEASVESDVGAATRLALKRLAPLMASQSVRTEIAVPYGLPVRMQGGALTDLLEELLTAATHGAPAGRLLLTATNRGDRIYINVTDDMPDADPAVRLGTIRGLMERVALRGGDLDVNVLPTEGTTMTLRLPAALREPRDEVDSDAAEPAAELFGSSTGFSNRD